MSAPAPRVKIEFQSLGAEQKANIDRLNFFTGDL